MKIKRFAFYALFCLLFFAAIARAQSVKAPEFRNGDRVCFVGNSITQSGEFHRNILIYYLTRFPGRKIEFYNNGISGDVTGGILNRINTDILVHRPTYAVIMIGMNDVIRSFYSTGATSSQVMEKRTNAIRIYKANLDSIVRIFLGHHIKVVLQQPSIYDQTSTMSRDNNYGVNDALKVCADYMQELADKYRLGIVDYWTIMSHINARLQEKDSTATIVGPDRIHPGMPGHFVMAYQFIRSTDLSPLVIKTVVAANVKASNKGSYNSRVKELKRTSDSISFYSTESALPFPVRPSAAMALQFIPFADSINREILQVNDAGNGCFSLLINDSVIGSFTGGQLRNGVNLSFFTNTPQYQKANAIRRFLDSTYFTEEASYRAVKYIEYQYLKGFDKKTDTAAVRAYLYQKVPKVEGYFKQMMDKYISCKLRENELLDNIRKYRQQAYDMARPATFHYQLIKTSCD